MINLTRLERASMGRLGREHVEENFSLPVVSGIYQNIITEALKTKRFY